MNIWYPQFDVYDCIRRILFIMRSDSVAEIGLERLFIADFFACNAPLLHKTTMSADDRKKFNALKITRPDKAFVSFPAAPLLFNRMAAVQKEAVATLAGKSALDLDRLARGYARLTESGLVLANDIAGLGATDDERHLFNFVAEVFSPASISEVTELRRQVGLRRVTV